MPIETQAFECTPSSLLASSPCLDCLSERQMLAVILGILALNSSQELPAMLQESACFMCMSKKQMLQALVTILGDQLLGEEATPADVLDDIKCLNCASEKQLLAAILYQTCTNITISGPRT